MTYPRGLLKAALVAAPVAVVGFGAQAADVVGTIQNQKQFSTFAKAIEAAGMADSLKGSGPYTIFAPTDQAFAQLPPGTMNYLMKQGNQDQLKKLLQYHVVQGKQLQADAMIGKQAKVDTVEGGQLSIDGTGRMVLLVPTGLTATRVGDQIVYRRQVAAMSAPAVEVAPAGQSGQQAQSGNSSVSSNQQQAQTEVTQQSDMPATKHQEEVLKQHPKTKQQQTMAQTEGAMPSTKHQREVLRGQQPGEQAGQQQAANGNDQQQGSGSGGNQTYQRQASATDESANQQAQTEVTEQSNMPATQHQEEVLKQHPKTEQQQTMAQPEGAMPSTKHQRQVLRGQQPGEQGGTGQQTAMREGAQNQGALREATVIGGPIKAENGVIYAIDGVLVPQSILSQVESHAQQGQGQMQNQRQGQSQQNKS